MSTPEHLPEAKSKVKLVTNAKGDVQPEISVVAGETAVELERIRKLAIDAYNATLSDLGIRMAGAR